MKMKVRCSKFVCREDKHFKTQLGLAGNWTLGAGSIPGRRSRSCIFSNWSQLGLKMYIRHSNLLHLTFNFIYLNVRSPANRRIKNWPLLIFSTSKVQIARLRLLGSVHEEWATATPDRINRWHSRKFRIASYFLCKKLRREKEDSIGEINNLHFTLAWARMMGHCHIRAWLYNKECRLSTEW